MRGAIASGVPFARPRAFAYLRSISVRACPAAGQCRTTPDAPGQRLCYRRPRDMSFNVISLQLGDETEMLDRAVEALQEVEPGETVFLPEYVAWTAHGSG